MKFDQSFSQIMKDLKFDFTDELGFFFQLIKQERKQHIIELSKEFGIVTPYTSFVAIEERKEVEYEGSFTGSCLIFWIAKIVPEQFVAIVWNILQSSCTPDILHLKYWYMYFCICKYGLWWIYFLKTIYMYDHVYTCN